MAYIAYVQRLIGRLYALGYCYIPTCRFTAQAFFVHRDAEQLVAFPHGPIAGVTIFRWSRRTASVLPLSSGIPPSAPRTGQVAFTTSGGPTNPVCVILARFHDVPPGDTLCRAPVLGSVGLYLRLLLPARSFWFSSCFYGVLALLGLLRSVDMFHQ